MKKVLLTFPWPNPLPWQGLRVRRTRVLLFRMICRSFSCPREPCSDGQAYHPPCTAYAGWNGMSCRSLADRARMPGIDKEAIDFLTDGTVAIGIADDQSSRGTIIWKQCKRRVLKSIL